MTIKSDILAQIQEKLWQKGIQLSCESGYSNELLDLSFFKRNVYIIEIPERNLISCNKFFIIVLRNKERTLMFETTELLNDKQLRNIVNFMRGIDVHNINPVRRYDKNRCVVNY